MCVLYSCLRHLLGIGSPTYLAEYKTRQMALLLYRDNLWTKHSSKERLRKELEQGKAAEVQAERERRKMLCNSVRTESSPLAEILLNHLVQAPCQNWFLHLPMSGCFSRSKLVLFDGE